MRVLKALSLSAFFVSALASPVASPYLVHEKRHERSNDLWTKLARLDVSAIVPVRIGLKQQNLEHGDRWLMEVSDPASTRYGKHWTAQEVIDAFKPSHETIKAVHDWLHEAGVHTDRHQLSEGLNWLQFDATVEEAEALFRTKFHMFEHTSSSTRHVACDDYSLPAHISSHVDFVSPGVHFDSKTKADTDMMLAADGSRIQKRDFHNPWTPGGGRGHHRPLPLPPKMHPHPRPENQICNTTFVTPACLRLLYSVPSDLPAVSGNSFGIVEYTPESYLPSDLDLFFEQYEPAAVGERPVFDSIDGGFLFDNFTNITAFDFLGEPSLDLQYAMSLVYPQDVILYQVGDLAEEDYTSFNNFLDAIDASYCTYDGGDNSTYDAVYPDPYPGPDSYQGTEDCGTYAAAKVISTSYSYDEVDLPASYEMRQCYEYMKLGLTGTTFLYSSGDSGVGGNAGCLDANGTFNDGLSGIFVPSFPGGCPYVLSVGATQIRNGTYDVDAAIEAGEQVEVVAELFWANNYTTMEDIPIGADPIGLPLFYATGGGFSNVFALPSYQTDAVTTYFDKYAPSYPGQYNDSGTTRGYPDIVANGAWYTIAVDGEFSPVFGTSASAPTVGSLLTLINGQRIKAGKSSVGFVNPTLYAHPEVLNDITLGSNPNCGTYGFEAEPGWDPASGLGTPNFRKMLELFLSLP